MIKSRLQVEQLEERNTPGGVIQLPFFPGAIELNVQQAQHMGLKQPPALLSGVATDAVTGDPLGNATITLTKESGTPITFTTTTNDDGTYSIGPLPPGLYTVTATVPDSGYQPQTFASVLEISGAKTILNFSLIPPIGT